MKKIKVFPPTLKKSSPWHLDYPPRKYSPFFTIIHPWRTPAALFTLFPRDTLPLCTSSLSKCRNSGATGAEQHISDYVNPTFCWMPASPSSSYELQNSRMKFDSCCNALWHPRACSLQCPYVFGWSVALQKSSPGHH